MKTYYISSLGYTIHPQDEGFSTLAAAKKELAAVVKEKKAKAKRRWKSAAIIKTGNRVAIHAMKHVESPCWGEYWITEV